MSNEKKAPVFVAVRVLSDFQHQGKSYKPNQLVEFTEQEVKALKDGDVVDDSKGAVEYCKNELKLKLIRHEPEVVSKVAASLDESAAGAGEGGGEKAGSSAAGGA